VAARIAVVDLPSLLCDIVIDAFGNYHGFDVEVLPAGSDSDQILAAQPDVLLVGASDPQHYPPAGVLLKQRPDLGLFAISPDARQAWIFELHPRSRRLGELSISSLRRAVQAVIDGRRP
jgi:hypothetical protein